MHERLLRLELTCNILKWGRGFCERKRKTASVDHLSNIKCSFPSHSLNIGKRALDHSKVSFVSERGEIHIYLKGGVASIMVLLLTFCTNSYRGKGSLQEERKEDICWGWKSCAVLKRKVHCVFVEPKNRREKGLVLEMVGNYHVMEFRAPCHVVSDKETNRRWTSAVPLQT